MSSETAFTVDLRHAGMADGLRVIIPATEETSDGRDELPARDAGAPAAARLSPLALYRRRKDGDGWCRQQFRVSSKALRIGSDMVRADIPLHEELAAADIHVVVYWMRDRWVFVETGVERLCYVNGVHRRQASLSAGDSCFLTVGATELLFTTLPEKGSQPAAAPPAHQQYFQISEGVEKFFFDFGRTVLIGKNPVCDIKAGDADFTALVTSIAGSSIFIHRLSGEIAVEDRPVSGKPLPLFNGSKVSVYSRRFQLTLPEGCREQSPGASAPHNPNPRLCLHGVDAAGGLDGRRLALPAAGGAGYIGRGAESQFHLDSQNASRRHAQLITYDSCFLVIDCGSRNHTFVNGERVGRRTVRPGDFLTFADCRFLVGYE